MYGLVNNGVRTYVIENHGKACWSAICAKAGVDEQEFETMTAYDDAVTNAMVGALSETLGLTVETALEVFGRYWVGFAQSTAIGKLIDMSGDTFWDRLRGLDDMHERIQNTMPELDPPGFDLEDMPDGSRRLHYHSSRNGLAPMVVGLLHGLAEECGLEVRIDHLVAKADGADHDVFGLSVMTSEAAA
ncbi:MAG: heme NO-binding domain-containing protein [Silicimonas sp.]|nr:heme NO-binding domain-containing protein [Silicimonas sp.]